MTIGLIIQIVLNGLTMGMIYVLVVLGLDLILRSSRILNFAHGQFYMLGAYGYFFSVSILHLHWILSIFISLAVAGLMGFLSYLGIFNFVQKRFLRGGSFSFRLLTSAMASVGLMMILQQGTLSVIGTSEYALPSVFPQMIHFAGATLPVERVVIIIAAWLLCGGLYLLMFKTRIGMGMRAVAFDPETSSLQGVNTFQIYLVSFIVGCALSGVAGGIIAPVFSVTPAMGTHIIFIAFMVMVVGGMGSYKGAIVGGLLLGLMFSFGFQFFGGVAYVYVFVAVLLVIIFRPEGMLGEALD